MASSTSSFTSPASTTTTTFTPSEQAFLSDLYQLNVIIDRILPMVNRNPVPTLLKAVCDLTSKLIVKSGSTIATRTFYVFSQLYRETTAGAVKPYLASRATEEIVKYIQEQCTKSKEDQDASITTILKVLQRLMDEPGRSPNFAQLTAAQYQLGLGGDEYFSGLFVFTAAQGKIMARKLYEEEEV